MNDLITKTIESVEIDKLNNILEIFNEKLSYYKILHLIYKAIKSKNIDILCKILKKILKSNLNHLSINHKNCLIIKAMETNDINILNKAIKTNDINILNKAIKTNDINILNKAIKTNDINILNKILETFTKANINHLSTNQINNLIINAVELKNINILNKILSKFYSYKLYSLLDNQIYNIIIHAIESKNINILDNIFKKILETNFNLTNYKIAYIITNSIYSNDINILNNILITFNRYYLNFTSYEIYKIISSAIYNKNINILNKILDNLSIINLSNCDINTLVIDAINSNTINILNKILEIFNITLSDVTIRWFINSVMKTHNIITLDAILDYYNVDITLDLLFRIIVFYKTIIDNKKETLQSLIILNKIFKKIKIKDKDTIINVNFYNELCNTMLISSIFFLDKSSINCNSKYILNIIQQFHMFNEEVYIDLIKQKKITIISQKNSNNLSSDPISIIVSYLGDYK